MQLLKITRDEAIHELAKLDLKEIIVDDSEIYYTTEAEWRPILLEAAAGLPAYKADRFDCDKFVIVVMADVYKKHQLNGLGIMRGTTSTGGYHAWIAYATENGIRYFEPQTEDFFKPGDNGLIPDTYGLT